MGLSVATNTESEEQDLRSEDSISEPHLSILAGEPAEIYKLSQGQSWSFQSPLKCSFQSPKHEEKILVLIVEMINS